MEMALPDLPGGQSLSAQTVYAEQCGLIVLRDDGSYALKDWTSWTRIGAVSSDDAAENGVEYVHWLKLIFSNHQKVRVTEMLKIFENP